MSALALGASLGANVVLLLGLLALLLFGHISLGAAGGPSSGSPALGAALRSPTLTSSVTPVSGWLRVTPSSVQLGCANGQQTQYVIVQNAGPERVQWQAVVSGAPPQSDQADHAAVTLSPDHGDLDAGASLPVQVQNTTHASDSQASAGQHGIIRFTATSTDAGTAPSLSYTTTGCP